MQPFEEEEELFQPKLRMQPIEKKDEEIVQLIKLDDTIHYPDISPTKVDSTRISENGSPAIQDLTKTVLERDPNNIAAKKINRDILNR